MMSSQAPYAQQQQQQAFQQNPQAGPSSAPYQPMQQQTMPNGASPGVSTENGQQQQQQQQHAFTPALPATFDREKLAQMSMVSRFLCLLTSCSLSIS